MSSAHDPNVQRRENRRLIEINRHLREALAAARKIHRPMQVMGSDVVHCWACSCLSDDEFIPWPCPTETALRTHLETPKDGTD